MNGSGENLAFQHERYRGYLQVLAEGRLDPRMRGLVDVDAIVEEVLQTAFRLREESDTDPLKCLPRLRKLLAAAMVSEAKRLGFAGQAERSAQRSVETSLRASTERLCRLITKPNQLVPNALDDPRALFGLADTIMLLPENERRAIEMRFLQNLPIAVIGQQLDCSREKVETILKEFQLLLKSQEA